MFYTFTPEAHFSKILCNIAHIRILLCATSHKIFEKWASHILSNKVRLSFVLECSPFQ